MLRDVPEPQPTGETLRIHQANERTMLAWIRTGIALMAFGFAIARFGLFLRQLASAGQATLNDRTIGSAWIGAVLVALGTIANLLATARFARIRRAIERGETGAPDVAIVYVFGGLAAGIGVVMTVLLVRSLGE